MLRPPGDEAPPCHRDADCARCRDLVRSAETRLVRRNLLLRLRRAHEPRRRVHGRSPTCLFRIGVRLEVVVDQLDGIEVNVDALAPLLLVILDAGGDLFARNAASPIGSRKVVYSFPSSSLTT
jgi:hypothetical protein